MCSAVGRFFLKFCDNAELSCGWPLISGDCSMIDAPARDSSSIDSNS